MSEPLEERDTPVRIEPPEPPDNVVRACVYGAALAAGVLLVIAGHTTPVEASGYVTPLLVVFERRRM
ncbi:hypothetical protein ACIQI7_08775 [Kitasatospora sp. NPDC092039]|uniref:hypothetical protein n=1 Tax=Kitasatospora sp. NPDC092039 TaxID=3364086 RepID=UPI003827982F